VPNGPNGEVGLAVPNLAGVAIVTSNDTAYTGLLVKGRQTCVNDVTPKPVTKLIAVLINIVSVLSGRIKVTVKQSTNLGCPTTAQKPVVSAQSRRTPVRMNMTSPVHDGNSRENVTLMPNRCDRLSANSAKRVASFAKISETFFFVFDKIACCS